MIYGVEEELIVRGYTNASFQINKDHFRSQSGYVFCLNGATISWKSSKQRTIVNSTIRAKYITTLEATKEAVWINEFIIKLGVILNIVKLV